MNIETDKPLAAQVTRYLKSRQVLHYWFNTELHCRLWFRHSLHK